MKDRFYEDRKDIISAVSSADKFIILGDFNARVGRDNTSREGVMGNTVWASNSNGLLLLESYITHGLLITNTVFRLPNRKKMSWMHPYSKH